MNMKKKTQICETKLSDLGITRQGERLFVPGSIQRLWCQEDDREGPDTY